MKKRKSGVERDLVEWDGVEVVESLVLSAVYLAKGWFLALLLCASHDEHFIVYLCSKFKIRVQFTWEWDST
jgi:hypothetical protein